MAAGASANETDDVIKIVMNVEFVSYFFNISAFQLELKHAANVRRLSQSPARSQWTAQPSRRFDNYQS